MPQQPSKIPALGPAAAAPSGPEAAAESAHSDVLISTTFGPREFLERWAAELRAAGMVVQAWPHAVRDLSRVEFAVVYDPPPGLLARCPNLKAVHSMGAGVSPGMLDPRVCPPHLPPLRLLDPLLAQRMATFALWAVINCHRRCDAYLSAQRSRDWGAVKAVDGPCPRDNGDVGVGVMGAGQMGSAAAEALAGCGYRVSVWSRTVQDPAAALQLPAGVRRFHGQEQLRAFAAAADVLVCLLPLTPQTRGILNARLFSWLPRGAALVQLGRGGQLVESDLLGALGCGQLAAAVLDVFELEPLPPESPLWTHPAVRVFPHAAATPDLAAAAARIASARHAVLAGGALPPGAVVDRERGY